MGIQCALPDWTADPSPGSAVRQFEAEPRVDPFMNCTPVILPLGPRFDSSSHNISVDPLNLNSSPIF